MKDYLRKNYDESNDIFGYPQVYKGISFYPIRLRDKKYLDILNQLLSNPKNYIANREILKTSYLKFLIYVLSMNNDSTPEVYMDLVLELLSHVTRVEKDKVIWRWKETGQEGLEAISFQLTLNGVEISELEFDDIREILLEQNSNGINFVEDYNPDLEKSLVHVSQGSSDITLMDEIFTLCAILKISIKEIEDYTFFQFRMMMEKVLTLKEYDLYKPLLVTGELTLKNGELKNYFYHSKKGGRYDSIMMSMEEFEKSDAYKATLKS